MAFAALATLPIGCAHAPLNAPLARIDPATGYRPQSVENQKNGTGIMVALFLSGGGTRAAAFSYGVLRELAATPVRDGRRMLDQVTTINAVSGGSFTAAYYCLYGNRIFADYERLFLKSDVQDALLMRCLSPMNGVRLCSPYFGLSDLAAAYYDELLFHGATFGDLAAGGPSRPFLVINATDISTNSPLQFTQDEFDLIGSDLGRFPISRAVAASSALPLVFSPIVLKNYSDLVPTAKLVLAPPSGKTDIFAGYRAALTDASGSYSDVAKHPFVYLMDGGLTDNLSLRNLLDEVTRSGGWEAVLERAQRRRITKLAIIVVDSTAGIRQGADSHEGIPGPKSVIKALGSSSITRTSRDTIALVEASLALRQAQSSVQNASALNQPKVYFIRVDFRSGTDPAERAFLEAVPTTLHLPADTVDRLVRDGDRLLSQSPDYRALLRDISLAPPADGGRQPAALP
jgi:NTE family protein